MPQRAILYGFLRIGADKSAESCLGDRQESLGGSYTRHDKSQYNSNKENDVFELRQSIPRGGWGRSGVQRKQPNHVTQGGVLVGLGWVSLVRLFALKLGGAPLDHPGVAAQLALGQHDAAQLIQKPVLQPRPIGRLGALEIRQDQSEHLHRMRK